MPRKYYVYVLNHPPCRAIALEGDFKFPDFVAAVGLEVKRDVEGVEFRWVDKEPDADNAVQLFTDFNLRPIKNTSSLSNDGVVYIVGKLSERPAAGGAAGGRAEAETARARTAHVSKHRLKFYQRTPTSATPTSPPGTSKPAAVSQGDRVYHIDGALFGQSQPTASLHLCSDSSRLLEPLCAKIYAPEATAAAEREIAAEQLVRGAGGVGVHPSTIIRFREVVRHSSGRIIIIMPFYLFSLADIISSYLDPARTAILAPPPPARLLAQAALGTAAALAHLHSLGMAHCDVKPSNIMLRHDGVPVLVDLAAMTELGKKPHEVSHQWVPLNSADSAARRDVIVATASAELDLRCLAASMFSLFRAERKASTVTDNLPFFDWAAVSALWQPAAGIVRLCWEAACDAGSSAVQLEQTLQQHISQYGLLTDDEMEACLL